MIEIESSEPLLSRRIRQIAPLTPGAFRHLVEHGEAPAVRRAGSTPTPSSS
ncbi:MAG: hypothetical protein JSU06_00660 [Actinobacteria bacterium]|nr:hypothetical protein [Actinomycetota bacterium]